MNYNSIESAMGALQIFSMAKEQGSKIADSLGDSNANNYVDFNRSTRVRFPVAVDSSLKFNPELSEIMRCVHKAFVSEYVRSIQLLSDLSGLEVIKRLERLNPDARWLGGAMDLIVANEDYQHLEGPVETDPDFDLSAALVSHNALTSMESRTYLREKKPEESEEKEKLEKPARKESISSRAVEGPKKIDLVIGSDVDVTFKTAAGADVPIKISIALQPFEERPESIIAAMTIAGGRNTFNERYHRYRAGELSGKEMLLMTDILKAYRDIHTSSSKSDFLKEIARRRVNVQSKSLVTNSVAQLSSCVVLEKSTAIEIERAARLKFDRRADRERMMDIMSCMLLLIVDADGETIKMYHTGISKPSTIYFSSLKSFNDDKQLSISDLLSKTTSAASSSQRSIF